MNELNSTSFFEEGCSILSVFVRTPMHSYAKVSFARFASLMLSGLGDDDYLDGFAFGGGFCGAVFAVRVLEAAKA